MNTLLSIADIFFAWTEKKINYHLDQKNDIFFYEKEIWWAALGQNIGYEINGKSNQFSRPVLILKKYSSKMCFVLPLTSQIKKNFPPYQFIVEMNGVRSAINLSQGRTISSRRLISKKGKLSAMISSQVTNSFISFFTKNDAPRIV